MKKILPGLVAIFAFFPMLTCAAPVAGRGRTSMAQQMSGPGRVGTSAGTVGANGAKNDVVDNNETVADAESGKQTDDENKKTEKKVEEKPKDLRAEEKQACLAGNAGLGNVFVWASRYSVGSDYSTMVEDVKKPENNACFVRVEISSNDAKINVSDMPAKYFEVGKEVECGEWVDKSVLKKRILSAKKTARVWGTVAASVGGAGLGVGAMELFGNRLIGGAVEGQKELSGAALLISQIKTLEKKDKDTYQKFVTNLRELRDACKNIGNAQNVDEGIQSKCAEYEPVWSSVLPE